MPLINQGRQRHKFFAESSPKALYTIFTPFSLGLLSTSSFIFSESSCHILAIIKNIYTVAKIHISDLDITAYINQKAGILITLQCMG